MQAHKLLLRGILWAMLFAAFVRFGVPALAEAWDVEHNFDNPPAPAPCGPDTNPNAPSLGAFQIQVLESLRDLGPEVEDE